MSKLNDPVLAHRATLTVLALVVFAIALNATGLFSPTVPTSATVAHLIGLVPTAFFVAAIWMVSLAAKAIARGHAKEAVLARLTGRLGVCLFLGGLAFVFLQPLLLNVFVGRWSGYAVFDIPAITLGCLGVLLTLVAHILRQAADVRRELDEIL